MEYSMDVVARKMIFVILILSAMLAIGGLLFFQSRNQPIEALPFAAGVAMAMGLNILKVFWLKHTVEDAVNMGAHGAANHLRAQNLFRLAAMFGMLFAAHLIPFVNLFGAAIGALAIWPLAMNLLRFTLKGQLTDLIVNPAAAVSFNAADEAIEEMNAIVKEAEQNQSETEPKE